jgi:flagellar biosynthetic protein FliR
MAPLEWLPAQATSFMLLFARVGAVLMLLPVFSEEGVPGRIRLLTALAMTFGLSGLLLPQVALADTGAGLGLGGTLVAELLVGLGLGLLVRILFQAVQIAGSIVSLQIGLSAAAIFDPSQGGIAPVLSRFIGVAAAVVCLSLGIHHLWIEAIVRSYDSFPVGALPAAGDMAALGVAAVSRSMALGLSLAAPLVVYGIVFNIVLALAARLAPAVQVFFVAQPLNLLLGLALTATVIGAMLSGFAAAFAGWIQAGFN